MLQYFEKRQKTYPQNVKGKFRSLKNRISFVCLTIFLFAPFIRWNRGLSVSNQAILIDIPNSRGYFFGIEMWPEEVYYLAAILICAAIALFFVTSLFGRVWCGYSCPQTVWTDLFIKIERFFQGDRNDRIKLDRKIFSFQNIWRKTATHLAWIIVGIITGIGFVNYFSDAPTLIKNLFECNLSPTQVGWILGIATSTYIMAGFAREQVCNYMCPYARFQGAMFDPQTLIISYDEKRGEPRAKHKKEESFENRGHCIDCKQCVVVCPANIDIRNGLQMECIACGLCIDACDNTMKQMNLPTGLIRYDTELNLKNNTHKFKLFRPRTFLYLAILLVITGLIFFNLTTKMPFKVDIIANRNPMFVMLSNGDIRNGYEVKISNKSFENKSYKIEISGINYLEIKYEGMENESLKSLPIKAGASEHFKVYLVVGDEVLQNSSGKNDIKFIVTENESGKEIVMESVFMSRN